MIMVNNIAFIHVVSSVAQVWWRYAQAVVAELVHCA